MANYCSVLPINYKLFVKILLDKFRMRPEQVDLNGIYMLDDGIQLLSIK
jgi:hypothetical protein